MKCYICKEGKAEEKVSHTMGNETFDYDLCYDCYMTYQWCMEKLR